MTDKEKVVQYETQIEDMVNVLRQRLSEFADDLDEFEQGRKLAYTEMLEIIATRHKMIMDVIED
jgi:hypothetical protein